MILLWETSSLKGIRLAEDTFINYAWVYEDIRCLNEIASGYYYNGGYFYLYILIG